MDVFVRLKIVSEKLTSDDIELAVGCQGTRKWDKGDIRPKTKILEKNNGWQFEKEYQAQEEIEIQKYVIDFLLGFSTEIKENIASVEDQTEALISCIIYTGSDKIPSLYINKEIMKEIVFLGADFDIDLYIFESK